MASFNFIVNNLFFIINNSFFIINNSLLELISLFNEL